jgi:hypothetical protein
MGTTQPWRRFSRKAIRIPGESVGAEHKQGDAHRALDPRVDASRQRELEQDNGEAKQGNRGGMPDRIHQTHSHGPSGIVLHSAMSEMAAMWS